MHSHKRQNDLCSFPRQTIHVTEIHVYAPATNAKEAEVEQFCENLQDLLELTPKKDVLCIIGDWNAKVGSQEICGLTGKVDFGVPNEAGQRLTVLPREHTGHSKHPSPTMQETTLQTDITGWSILKLDSSQPKMEKLFVASKNKTGSWLWIRSWAPYWKIQT